MLTEAAIDKWAATATTGAVLWDGKMPGFGVRKWQTCATYVVTYRAGRRARWLKLGRVGALRLTKARKLAHGVLGEVSGGADPAQARDAMREADTMREAGEKWLAHIRGLRKPHTAKEYAALWARTVVPRLGTLAVRDVDRADTARLHAALGSTPGEANHALAVLSSFFSWCERVGLRPQNANPCRGVPRYRKPTHTRYLSPAELQRLGKVLDVAARDGHLTVTDTVTGTKRTEPVCVTALRVVRLLALTGARLDEIRALRWDAIDAAAGVARLADSKTGPKVLVLTKPALDVLDTVPRFVHSPYVFPSEGPKGRAGRHFMNVHRTWFLVRRAADLDGVRVHDLRHTAAALAAGAGVSLPIVGKLLGHSQPSTTARYAHIAPSVAAEAAALVSKAVAGALAAGARSNVRPFKARART